MGVFRTQVRLRSFVPFLPICTVFAIQGAVPQLIPFLLRVVCAAPSLPIDRRRSPPPEHDPSPCFPEIST